jgi:hypothetical protein
MVQIITFKPLWDDTGPPPHGYVCLIHIPHRDCLDNPCAVCNRVTRTRKGMMSHLRIVHGTKLQKELFPYDP